VRRQCRCDLLEGFLEVDLASEQRPEQLRDRWKKSSWTTSWEARVTQQSSAGPRWRNLRDRLAPASGLRSLETLHPRRGRIPRRASLLGGLRVRPPSAISVSWCAYWEATHWALSARTQATDVSNARTHEVRWLLRPGGPHV
jgi:hypothetical protein